VKSANLLKLQALWFCGSPFGIAHHSGKSPRILISGCRFFIIRLRGALVRGISLSRRCFAASVFSSRYWNSCLWDFVLKLWKPSSWSFDGWYVCLRSIIAFSWSSERTFKRLPSWQIWSGKRCRRCIFTKLKSGSSKRWCAICDSLCVLSSTMWQRFAPAQRLFQARSLSRSSRLSKVTYFCKDSDTFFVDLLARNRLKITLWRWISSR